MKPERVVYYTDPLKDDFAGTKISTVRVDASFPYLRRSLPWRVGSFLMYYGVAVPIVWLTAKLYLGLKFENRAALKKVRGRGFFLYGNHTQVLDVYVPALAAFPRRAYIIASPDAVSIPGIRRLVMMLGALPLPADHTALRPFREAVAARCGEGACIAVYPEAHIWPFYTGIRPFPDTSFAYPVEENAPAVAMVTTYRRRRGLFSRCRRPGMTVTFSEPVTPDPAWSPRAARQEMHRRIHAFMDETARNTPQVEFIRYVQKPADREERQTP